MTRRAEERAAAAKSERAEELRRLAHLLSLPTDLSREEIEGAVVTVIEEADAAIAKAAAAERERDDAVSSEADGEEVHPMKAARYCGVCDSYFQCDCADEEIARTKAALTSAEERAAHAERERDALRADAMRRAAPPAVLPTTEGWLTQHLRDPEFSAQYAAELERQAREAAEPSGICKAPGGAACDPAVSHDAAPPAVLDHGAAQAPAAEQGPLTTDLTWSPLAAAIARGIVASWEDKGLGPDALSEVAGVGAVMAHLTPGDLRAIAEDCQRRMPPAAAEQGPPLDREALGRCLHAALYPADDWSELHQQNRERYRRAAEAVARALSPSVAGPSLLDLARALARDVLAEYASPVPLFTDETIRRRVGIAEQARALLSSPAVPRAEADRVADGRARRLASRALDDRRALGELTCTSDGTAGRYTIEHLGGATVATFATLEEMQHVYACLAYLPAIADAVLQSPAVPLGLTEEERREVESVRSWHAAVDEGGDPMIGTLLRIIDTHFPATAEAPRTGTGTEEPR